MDLQVVATSVFYALILPGFVFTAIVGLFLTWIDRKVAAVVQSRVGPPWFQPFADIGKLLGKKMIIPRGSQVTAFVAAPLVAVAGSTLAAVIVLRAVIAPDSSFVGDLIVVIYLTTIPAIALIIGGAASRSPFGAIGAGREMGLILAYEVGFLLSAITVLVKVGSIRLGDIAAYQMAHGPIAWSLSGLLALGVSLLCIQAKLGFLPFDISEADTELIGGPLAEYSGAGLALFKLARAMMFLTLPVLLVVLFLGAPQHAPLSWLAFFFELIVVITIIIVVKTTHARLRLDQALGLFWGRLAAGAAVCVALALLGL